MWRRKSRRTLSGRAPDRRHFGTWWLWKACAVLACQPVIVCDSDRMILDQSDRGRLPGRSQRKEQLSGCRASVLDEDARMLDGSSANCDNDDLAVRMNRTLIDEIDITPVTEIDANQSGRGARPMVVGPSMPSGSGVLPDRVDISGHALLLRARTQPLTAARTGRSSEPSFTDTFLLCLKEYLDSDKLEGHSRAITRHCQDRRREAP